MYAPALSGDKCNNPIRNIFQKINLETNKMLSLPSVLNLLIRVLNREEHNNAFSFLAPAKLKIGRAKTFFPMVRRVSHFQKQGLRTQINPRQVKYTLSVCQTLRHSDWHKQTPLRARGILFFEGAFSFFFLYFVLVTSFISFFFLLSWEQARNLIHS